MRHAQYLCRVSELCSAVEVVSGQVAESQVLMTSNGQQMDPHNIIGAYSVGTVSHALATLSPWDITACTTEVTTALFCHCRTTSQSSCFFLAIFILSPSQAYLPSLHPVSFLPHSLQPPLCNDYVMHSFRARPAETATAADSATKPHTLPETSGSS